MAENWIDWIGSVLGPIAPGLAEQLPQFIILTLSLALYGVLIYHFVSRRDEFGFSLRQYQLAHSSASRYLSAKLIGLIEYAVIFPIFVLVWFSCFTILLSLLAKNLPLDQLLLVSVTLVSAIRVTAYYNENLSQELAKLIPLVLLGVALIEPNFFSLPLVLERIRGISQLLHQLPLFFAFIILTEWALRILLELKHLLFGFSKKEITPKKEE